MDPCFFTVWVLEIFSLDLNILSFVTFDYVMKWCINVRYFKSVSYDHGKIQLKETLLGKRVNSDPMDMRAKEKSKFWFYTCYLHSLVGIISFERVWNDLEYL